MPRLFALNFRTGLLIGFAVAIAVAAGAITLERYDTQTLKRKVDVLSRNTTWNLSRETNYALHFAAVSYYDGQGFMVPKSREVESALELGGAKVCVQSGTTTELNLTDYFRANNMKYQEMKFAKMDDVFKAYDGGQCDV